MGLKARRGGGGGLISGWAYKRNKKMFRNDKIKPGFHIIVRVVPVASVFSNYVQATGTIVWKHHRDDRGRSKKTEKTGTIAIAWIEKFLSGGPKRSRKIVNVLMETTFGRPGRPKRLRRSKYILQCTVLSPPCSKNGCVNRIVFKHRTFIGLSAEIRLPI